MDTLTIYFPLLALCLLGVSSMNMNVTLEREDKIIDGEEVIEISNFGYNAFVLLSDGRKLSQCGGSILSQNYVLTAASCLLGIETALIRIGSTFSTGNSPFRDYLTQTFNTHPYFNPRNYDFDAGLIIVREGMFLNGFRAYAITLPTTLRQIDPPPGLEVQIQGWGLIHENDTEFPIILHEAITHVVDREACSQMIGRRVTMRQFCAGETLRDEHPDVCLGDYGGPVVALGGASRQMGIASFGRRSCGQINAPSVYTRVDASSIRMYIYYETGL